MAFAERSSSRIGILTSYPSARRAAMRWNYCGSFGLARPNRRSSCSVPICGFECPGDFAFCIWDRRRRQIFCARDPLGIKPLYYAKGQGWLACASEVQALTHCGLIAGEVDRRALAGFLAYGGVQEPLTIVANVFALPRGSWKEFDGSGQVTGEGRYCIKNQKIGVTSERPCRNPSSTPALRRQTAGRHPMRECGA